MLSRLNVCVGVILAVGLGGCVGTGKKAELPPPTGGPAPSVVTGGLDAAGPDSGGASGGLGFVLV